MPSEPDKWGWEHVSVFGEFDRGSGTKRWKCNHCNLRYNGSYSRVRAHLLGFSGVGVKSCPAIDKSLREAFRILEEERLLQKKKKKNGDGKAAKPIRTSQPSLTWKTITKDDVDEIVARFFYADGLNVEIIHSPYFHEMVKAISAFGPSYELPRMDQLLDSSLNKEKVKIEKTIALIRESWPHAGCTILCIGRLEGAMASIHVNIFVASVRGHIFLKALYVDVNGDHVFSSALGDVITDVGPSNVFQIISQLGDACKSSASYICSKFPNIFWSPCMSHSILILMEEIADLEWIKTVVLCAKEIEQCMISYEHSSPLPLLQNVKVNSDHISAKFAPSCYIVRRIFSLRQGLREVVLSEEWNRWKHSMGENVTSVESTILGDDYWNKAHLVLQIYEPFLKLIDKLDIDKCVNGAIHEWRVQALEAIRSKAIDDGILNQVEGLVEKRWDVLFSPLHAAGFILNPRYIGKGQTKDKLVMRGWKTTLEIYESESDARRILREQLSSYWRLEGSSGEEDAVDCRDKIDPVAWWVNFGFDTPDLQTLAIKVLSQVSSVTVCQEIWQTNNFLCQDTATRFGGQRMDDLLFVCNNLRLNNHRSSHLCSSSGSRNVSLCQKNATSRLSP